MRPVKFCSEKDGPPPGFRAGIRGRRSAVSGRKSEVRGKRCAAESWRNEGEKVGK